MTEQRKVVDMEYISQNVARNLKRVRKTRKMSLDDVAEQTGVSKSMLGQIERGESNPTVETLGKIVSGLRIPFTSLVNSANTDVIIVNKEGLLPFKSVEGEYQFYEYFPYEESRTFEIYMMQIHPRAKNCSGGHGENTFEYLTVIAGILTLEAEGKIYEIKEGDSIRFPTHGDHIYSNNTDEILKFVITFTWN
ncbi:MAG: DNA-binding protein [Lachnospiraceae bacterium]|jgi:transcriptional regulator with XRE-family HTH domain|nr:DNA-binding protein [Lachnospiraceae bacterium]